MAKLAEEYMDRKSIRHPVEHITLPSEDAAHRERLTEELIRVLTEGEAGGGRCQR